MSAEESIEAVRFGAADYAVFGAMLLISTGIGIFYAWKDRNEKDADAYLLGKGNMSPIPVAISLCVSYVSGILMVGFPTMVYYYGSIVAIWTSVIYIVGPLITGLYYIPLFFRLKIMSVYEIIYMGMVAFVPCLSLSAVSDVSMSVSILLTCSVCTFYTTLGGIKAVIWTDVLQAAVMVAGMVSVIVAGTTSVGGVGNVTAALSRGDRLNFVELSFNPYLRHSTWSIIFGMSIIWTMMSAVNQPMVQRFLCCGSIKKARIAAWTLLIPQQTFFWLAVATGMVMYAYFEGCDPLDSGAIEMADQALPYMVVNLFQNMPGLAGVFVAAVFSGTLSTISSGINSLSTVMLSDYILKAKPELEKRSLIISKVLAVFLGALVLACTFVVWNVGRMLIDLVIAVFGGIGGPLLGVYTLALFVPWANEKGAVTGQFLGMVIAIWMSVGQILYPPPEETLQIRPVYTNKCISTLPNDTTVPPISTTDFTTTEEYRPPIADTFYAISSNYVGLVGFLITIIFGIIISGLTGFDKPKYANSDIFTPFIDNKLLPGKVIKFFRLGVPEREKVPRFDSEEEKVLEDDTTRV